MIHRILAVLAIGLLCFSVASCKKKTAEDKLAEAKQLIEERQMALSILKLKDLIAEFPEEDATVNARIELTKVYLRLGTPENLRNAIAQTEAIWKQVGVKDERGRESFLISIDLHRQAGNFPKALEQAELGVEMFKEIDADSSAQMQLIFASLLMGSESTGDQERGVSIVDNLMLEGEPAALRAQAKEILADHHRRAERYLDSNDVYERYMTAYPDDDTTPELTIAMAINLKQAEEPEQAAALFTKGESAVLARIDGELDPGAKVQMRRVMSRYYQAMGDGEGAEKMLRDIMSEMPRSREAIMAQFDIGHLFAGMERFDEAIALFEQIARENPNTTIAQNAQSFIGQIRQYVQQLEMQKAAEAEAGTEAADEAPVEEAAPAGQP